MYKEFMELVVSCFADCVFGFKQAWWQSLISGFWDITQVGMDASITNLIFPTRKYWRNLRLQEQNSYKKNLRVIHMLLSPFLNCLILQSMRWSHQLLPQGYGRLRKSLASPVWENTSWTYWLPAMRSAPPPWYYDNVVYHYSFEEML